HDARNVRHHQVRVVEAVGDGHLFLRSMCEDVPPVAGLLVLPQHLVDREDNTSELSVLIGIRMRPKYHVASTLKGSRDDVTGGPQRAVRGVVVVSAPSRSVEQGPTGGSACAVRGPDD